MPENSEEGLSHLIRYLYGLELSSKDLSCDITVELFKTTHKYKLIELQSCLGKMLLKNGQDWFTPDDLLELYFHVKHLTGFLSLKEHLLQIMLSLSKEIRECERFHEIEETDAKAATELVWKLFDLKLK